MPSLSFICYIYLVKLERTVLLLPWTFATSVTEKINGVLMEERLSNSGVPNISSFARKEISISENKKLDIESDA